MTRSRNVVRKHIEAKLDGKSDYEQWLLTESQAARIIEKLGGPYPLARKIGYDASQIFRWRYPEPPHTKRGTGGIVPQRALRLVMVIARNEGILLTPDDLMPVYYAGDKGLPSRHADLESLLS